MNDWDDLSLNVQISEGISEGYIPTDYDTSHDYSRKNYTNSNKRIFNSFEEAKEWAKNNIGKSFTRYGNNQFIEK